jgi:hypothetical protein
VGNRVYVFFWNWFDFSQTIAVAMAKLQIKIEVMSQMKKFFLFCLWALMVPLALNAAEIKIKMGGQPFFFDESLLKQNPDSTLSQMLISDFAKPQQDQEGFYIVDGDPEYFRHILSYWRYGSASIKHGVDLDLLREQAAYWGAHDFCYFIDGLRKGLDLNDSGVIYRMVCFQNSGEFNERIESFEKEFHILSIERVDGIWGYLLKLIPKI